ncbi:MAG: glycosyltransferase [Acidimicrobiales bacterium]
MSRFLIVTWDGAGNLMSTLGIAQRLADAGHDVRLLGHPSIDERCGQGGWTFRKFASAAEYDATNPGDLAEEMPFLIQNVFFSADVARDVATEFERSPADVLVVDALLPAALCAAEALPAPSAALFHSPYCLFRGGPLLDMISMAFPMITAIRSDLGLDPVEGIPQLHDRCELALVASPREFEAPGEPAPNVRFVGPILDGPTLAPAETVPCTDDGPEPLVVVSFSTSDMGQAPLLQGVLDALGRVPASVLVTSGPAVDPTGLRAAANAEVVGYVPHGAVLTKASVVVTHGGLGTVMAALAHGVPLVCMPMGRDQFFNAGRVTELGAGRTLPTDADASLIAETVASVLADPALRDGAKRMATAIAGCGGSVAAVGELERLLVRPVDTATLGG